MLENKSNKSSPQKTSPVKSQQYHNLEESKQQIINRLLYTFTWYSSKASKYAYKELNEKYFMELISDMHEVTSKTLIKGKNSYMDYENMYYARGKKHGILFGDFLQLLPAISVFFCPETDREHAVRTVIEALTAVYESKVAQNIEAHLVEYDEPINDDTKEFLLKLVPSFTTLYKIYFKPEVASKFNSKDPEQESFECYLNLMKDFEVYPKLASASQLYLLYTETIKAGPNNMVRETEYLSTKMEDKGSLFTLSKLLECIVSTSRVSLPKLKNVDNPEYDLSYQKEILKTLLEYMETIKSTKSTFKNSHFKEHRFSFLVYEEYPAESLMKTFLVKDKVVKEAEKQMDFFKIFGQMKI